MKIDLPPLKNRIFGYSGSFYGVLFELEDVFEKIFIACGEVFLVLFGINKIRKTPIKKFFAEYSGNIEDIENSYMYGDKLFCRRSFSGSGKRFTVQLDEFQTEMLYERLKIRYSEPKISRETISEFST